MTEFQPVYYNFKLYIPKISNELIENIELNKNLIKAGKITKESKKLWISNTLIINKKDKKNIIYTPSSMNGK